MGAALGTGIRLAARRAHLGQPESERAEPLDGALLSGHRHARRHDAVRRPRHDAPAGALRRTGRWISRRSCARCSAWRRSGCAGCRLRPCWFEPTFHKHTGSSVRACTCTSKTRSYAHEAFRPWRLQALAFKALRRLRTGLSAVARLSLRVRARAARDRPDQRQRIAARLGGRRGGHARRPGGAGAAGRSTHGASSAPPC